MKLHGRTIVPSRNGARNCHLALTIGTQVSMIITCCCLWDMLESIASSRSLPLIRTMIGHDSRCLFIDQTDIEEILLPGESCRNHACVICARRFFIIQDTFPRKVAPREMAEPRYALIMKNPVKKLPLALMRKRRASIVRSLLSFGSLN